MRRRWSGKLRTKGIWRKISRMRLTFILWAGEEAMRPGSWLIQRISNIDDWQGESIVPIKLGIGNYIFYDASSFKTFLKARCASSDGLPHLEVSSTKDHS
jgi:hypothetical protein